MTAQRTIPGDLAADRCPAAGELLAHALGGEGRESDEIARHLASCRRCGREVRRLREAVGAVRSTAATRSSRITECLDELTIAAAVDGELTAEDRPVVIGHLADCRRCRGRVASVDRLLRDPNVATALGDVDAPRGASRGLAGSRGRWVGGTAALAGLAAALLLVVARPDDRRDDPPAGVVPLGAPVYREQPVTTTGAPRLIAPTGMVPSADTLRWTSVPKADRYRVTVFDRDGAVAVEEETRDTMLVLRAPLGAASDRLYLWRVEARTGWDRWVESALVEFSISPTRSLRR
jgi:anti-sigma factor RsiW